MFRNEKVNVPVLGLVENMAWFTPAELPQNRYYLFGREGVKRLAEEMQVPLLAQIPIVQGICEAGDNGSPIALNEDSLTGQAFMSLAANVVEQTELRNATQPATQRVVVTKH
jgi:ATP-binding protein involved in chromosome partitioning